LKKGYINRRSVGGSALETPLASGGWGLSPQTPALLLALASYVLLRLFFTPNSAVLLVGGAKILFTP